MKGSLMAFILLLIGTFDIGAALISKVPMGQKIGLILMGVVFLVAAFLTVLKEKQKRK